MLKTNKHVAKVCSVIQQTNIRKLVLVFLVRGETVNKFKSIITCFTDWTNFPHIHSLTHVNFAYIEL